MNNILFTEQLLGIGVGIVILAVLAFDLGILQKEAHALSLRSAILWSAFWIAFALLFNVIVYFTLGSEKAIEFLSGFLVEKSLSVDNLFVFLIIFNYFHVPVQYQHKVLFWGIFGALVMRGLLIYMGLQLLERFDWLTYVLGALLMYTGYKTAFHQTNSEPDLSKNRLLRLLRRFLPISSDYSGPKFIIRKGKRWLFSPLFVVLIMIETTDVLFALDSVPAILGITNDPFVLYTSNLFAILGLRALYFVLAGLFGLFHHLKYGISAVLVFVGFRMLIEHKYPISDPITLLFIGTFLGGSMWASIHYPDKSAPKVETILDVKPVP